MSDTFMEHLTNAINQRYIGIYMPPATTDLRTSADGGLGGGSAKWDTCGPGGGVKMVFFADVLYGQPLSPAGTVHIPGLLT